MAEHVRVGVECSVHQLAHLAGADPHTVADRARRHISTQHCHTDVECETWILALLASTGQTHSARAKNCPTRNLATSSRTPLTAAVESTDARHVPSPARPWQTKQPSRKREWKEVRGTKFERGGARVRATLEPKWTTEGGTRDDPDGDDDGDGGHAAHAHSLCAAPSIN